MRRPRLKRGFRTRTLAQVQAEATAADPPEYDIEAGDLVQVPKPMLASSFSPGADQAGKSLERMWRLEKAPTWLPKPTLDAGALGLYLGIYRVTAFRRDKPGRAKSRIFHEFFFDGGKYIIDPVLVEKVN